MKRKQKILCLIKIKLRIGSVRGVNSNGTEIRTERPEDCRERKMFHQNKVAGQIGKGIERTVFDEREWKIRQRFDDLTKDRKRVGLGQ
jgi:hypothetical protein